MIDLGVLADNRESSLLALLVLILVPWTISVLSSRRSSRSQPPWLPETIPYISNTYQYIMKQKAFLDRAGLLLETNSTLRYRLGGQLVYMTVEAQNIQALFKTSKSIGNEALMAQMIFPNILGMPKHEVARFQKDTTGRAKVPIPGTETALTGRRLWSANHHIYTEYLARTSSTSKLTEIYHNSLLETLEQQPVDQWTTVSLVDFCRNQMGRCALEALFGPRIFAINPDILQAFWGFEAAVAPLFRGVPRWWNPEPYAARDRFFGMVERYLKSAFENYDWEKKTREGGQEETDWDPHFGAAVLREIARWLKDERFCDRTGAAFVGQAVFAATTNTVPITTWALMEAVKDPQLLADLRAEVQGAVEVDPDTGERTLNAKKLLTLPLFQSVYAETLRMHMSFSIVREVREPLVMDGFAAQKGSLIEAPMQIAHKEEAVWGVPGHPASEFWARRHVRYVEAVDENGVGFSRPEFAMAGRPSSFFPYGGGLPVCPGRHFAKQEIMVTLALVVARFDMEFVEWTNMDGSPSDRPARDNEAYEGAEAMPPDRDMKIKWKRVW
ncbi:putative cytochrome P450 [Xylariomycetidae sp. FL2044]|nr:putative cytochrome P450 [Xylariomycetidae sp. FL2044]